MKHWDTWMVAALSFGLATAADAQSTITYTYDARGRVIAAAYSSGWTTSYSYDAVDNRTRMVMSLSGYVGGALPPVRVFAGMPTEIDLASAGRAPGAAARTLMAVEGATKGAVSISQSGRVIYTPNPGAQGVDSISYTLADGAVTERASIRVDILQAAVGDGDAQLREEQHR